MYSDRIQMPVGNASPSRRQARPERHYAPDVVSHAPLLSPAGHVLALIARDPDARAGDIAATLGLSEANVRRVIADHLDAGHLERRRTGSRASLVLVDSELARSLTRVLATDAPRGGGEANDEPSRRDEARAQLGAAVEEFLEHGASFAELSVEQLIRSVGMSRSTFYGLFRDKDDLLNALIEDLMRELSNAARRWTDLDATLTKQDLHLAMTHIATVQRPHRRLMAAAAASPESSAVRANYNAIMDETRGRIRDHITRGQREGFVHAHLDADRLAGMLNWGAELRLSQIPPDTDDAKLNRISESLTDLLWNLLYSGRPPAEAKAP